MFFFNDTATTEIYTLSLHDALPICIALDLGRARAGLAALAERLPGAMSAEQLAHGRSEGTRLNSSHGYISYAVFCLKKKRRSTALSWSCTPVAAAWRRRRQC